MNKKDKAKSIAILMVITIMVLLGISIDIKAQSIKITAKGYTLEINDEEKVIKQSSSLLKAKENYSWETNINLILIVWTLNYDKDAAMYTLSKNNIVFYRSSTIAGIKSKYISELLETKK